MAALRGRSLLLVRAFIGKLVAVVGGGIVAADAEELPCDGLEIDVVVRPSSPKVTCWPEPPFGSPPSIVAVLAMDVDGTPVFRGGGGSGAKE